MVVFPSCAEAWTDQIAQSQFFLQPLVASLVSVQALAGWRWSRSGCLNPGSWQEGVVIFPWLPWVWKGVGEEYI